MLLGDPDLGVVGGETCIRDAREEAAAGPNPDPGGQRTLRGDEEASLLVDLADGAPLEALAGGEATRGRLPGAGGSLEQEHPSVRTDRQDAGDEIRLQTTPGVTLLSLDFMRRV